MFNNNILLAGTFSNETVTLKVKCPADFNADLIELGLMDLAKLEGFINSYSKYDENIEIVSGLKEGDTVLFSNSSTSSNNNRFGGGPGSGGQMGPMGPVQIRTRPN